VRVRMDLCIQGVQGQRESDDGPVYTGGRRARMRVRTEL
jgi:hypothetical protein